MWLKAVVLAALAARLVAAQQDDLGLDNGFIELDLPKFKAQLVREAQVLVSLQPKESDFDFLPRDRLEVRARNGQYHWGDITYRYREEGASEWIDGDSSKAREPLEGETPGDDVVASSNMGPTLPKSPLVITREWLDVEGDLGLRFTIENKGDSAVELGSLGFPAEFNSIFTGRAAEDMQAHCSLSDPYIGVDAGQIRVTPVKGTGQALVVTPLNGTISHFEAYRNLREQSYEETYYGSQTFEGFYEWQVLSKAWAETEWADQTPWNPPSAVALKPGESIKSGVRFSLSEGVRQYDEAVRNVGVPVARSVPGYIVPRDLPALLWLDSDSPVTSMATSPEGAFSIESTGEGKYTLTPSNSAWGRVRLTVQYEDGRVQTIHYYITKPTDEVLSNMGSFLTTEAWFNDTSDPFNRAPSVMTYNYEKGAIVEQDARVWTSGLSDEAGTGAYVAAMIKQVLQPNTDELAKLDEFVNTVIWGEIQNEDYSVKKSIFYYEPDAVSEYDYDPNINWGTWTSWDRQASNDIGRAYNYVHPAAAYWSLYRVARAYPATLSRDWSWYLKQAHRTAVRMTQSDVYYRDVGLMGETVFGEILNGLKREGKDCMAKTLEDAMRKRAELWDSQEIPYGSEMAWDSTGQEGVYYWTRHFGMAESETKTINSVLGYTPNVPHWGWDGNARRYWDFIYGGAAIQRIERQIHHYGSGLNAQVLLGAFRDDPSDSYLLRTGYGGALGPLSNINEEGFPSAAFHSWPDTLKWDAVSGDYGGGFLGMALSSGTYVSDDKDLGLVAYGGILKSEGGTVTVEPKDAVRRRVFVGPLKVLVTIDAGAVKEFSYNVEAGTFSLTIGQQKGALVADKVAIWIESTAGESWAVAGDEVEEGRGGWIASLAADGVTTVGLGRSSST